MAGRKVDAQKAKEARQKKLLLALAPVLVLLLAFQVPKLMKGSTTPAAAPAVTARVPTATIPVPVATAQLADTDVAPTPSEGQLVRFDLFRSKDPFVQQVKDVTPTQPAPAAPTPPKPASVVPVPSTTIGAYTTVPPAIPKTSVARIAVDGKAENVLADRPFPAASPAFRLVSFTSTKAEIAVAGGSFATGAPTLTLERGVTLTLENTADGTRYVLVYLGPRKVPAPEGNG